MGYIGYSRSERSLEAISNYEVPLNSIKKSLIVDYLKENESDFSEKELLELKNTSVSIWKYAAKMCGPSSWHHTSKYYNKTDHYSLSSIAELILSDKEKILAQYNNLKESNKEITYDYGVIRVLIWGGTRKRPKVVGEEEVAGIIIGEWLYYSEDTSTSKYRTINKYNIYANKVAKLDRYDTYEELIKAHKNYKSTKRYFNSLIKEKVK